MYIPAIFREERLEPILEIISEHPLATLITLGPEGLVANHIPLIHSREPAPWGTLRGHMARPNTQWREYRPEVEALAVFTGPQTYISPNWYPTKDQTGKVVPTWNYAVVHAYGRLESYTDPERLRSHLTELTATQEARFNDPWSINDAPSDFIDALLNSIVGIELKISRFEGKWKVSQNRTVQDREGVAYALENEPAESCPEMARLVRERESGQ